MTDPPIPLHQTRTVSATFPLTHGSSTRPDDVSPPFAETLDQRAIPRHVNHKYTSSLGTPGTTSPGVDPSQSQHRHRHRHRPHHSHSHSHSYSRSHIDPFGLGLDGHKSHSRHKHSKSRELRFPRPMSHLASASARGLLPTWSGRDKDRDADDGLLRPMTRETTRSRWGSESTRGGSSSRRGSLLDVAEQHERLGPIRRQEIQSMEDLERVKKRRKQGEEYLRSALSSIGTQATDATRRLDYTYYNLLEKITSLNSTIGLFQELSDSASTFLNDFEQETTTLDQEIRKQVIELKGFTPQTEKATGLESRMKEGRKRMQDLGSRLEAVKDEINHWERRETEWQERTSRRLRIFWAIVGSAFTVLLFGLVLQNWPSLEVQSEATQMPDRDMDLVNANQDFGASHNESLSASISISIPIPRSDTTAQSVLGSILHSRQPETETDAWYPAGLADRRQSLEASESATTEGRESSQTPTHDPFRVIDEL